MGNYGLAYSRWSGQVLRRTWLTLRFIYLTTTQQETKNSATRTAAELIQLTDTKNILRRAMPPWAYGEISLSNGRLSYAWWHCMQRKTKMTRVSEWLRSGTDTRFKVVAATFWKRRIWIVVWIVLYNCCKNRQKDDVWQVQRWKFRRKKKPDEI